MFFSLANLLNQPSNPLSTFLIFSSLLAKITQPFSLKRWNTNKILAPTSKNTKSLEISGFAKSPIFKWVQIPLMLLQDFY